MATECKKDVRYNEKITLVDMSMMMICYKHHMTWAIYPDEGKSIKTMIAIVYTV